MNRTSLNEPASHWRDGRASYGALSRLNHWIVALLMIGLLSSGLTLEYAPLAQALSGTMRDWHKAVGVIVLGLGLWRVGWRVAQGFPKSAGTGPAWQEHAAKLAYWALLAAIIVMPLSGLIMTLFAGRSIDVAGLTIPAAPQIDWLSQVAGSVHAIGGLTLAGLVGVHILAALKHHLIDRDDTLWRMISGPRPVGELPPSPDPVGEAEVVRS